MSEMTGKTGPETMNGAQAVMKSLVASGVDTIFGYPGGQAIALYDALYDEKELNHILVRHEQGAAHAADGYARATGKPGVVMVTSGPGATNVVTGIMTASMDSVPMVVICGQVPTTAIGTDAFQETDITGVTLPIVKHSYLIKDASEIASTIWKAFHIATTGRPGPVIVDIPSNVQKAEIAFEWPDRVDTPSYKPTVKGHARQIKQAARELAQSEKPVLFIGGGTTISDASEEVRALAEKLQLPVVNTLMAKGVLPDDHPLSMNMVGMHGTRFAAHAIQNAELLLAVGLRFDDRVTMRLDKFAPHARVIHIDIDPAEIAKNVDPIIPIVGDAKTVLSDLVSEIERNDYQPKTEAWLEELAAVKAEKPLSYNDSVSDQIPPEKLIEQMQEAAAKFGHSDDLIITTDVGQHQMWAAQFVNSTEPRKFLTSGGAGTMGYGLPAAMGAQFGHPDSLVVCISGDGSIQMNSQEMATISHNCQPVKVLLIDNSALGMVCQWQEILYKGRMSETDLNHSIPDFVKLAEAYGWSGKRISHPDEVEEALEWLFTTPGPAILDAITAKRELVLPMVLPGKSLSEAVNLKPRPAYRGRPKDASDSASTQEGA